jgi:hypothetical protein
MKLKSNWHAGTQYIPYFIQTVKNSHQPTNNLSIKKYNLGLTKRQKPQLEYKQHTHLPIPVGVQMTFADFSYPIGFFGVFTHKDCYCIVFQPF